jgi:hypothetical protein
MIFSFSFVVLLYLPSTATIIMHSMFIIFSVSLKIIKQSQPMNKVN